MYSPGSATKLNAMEPIYVLSDAERDQLAAVLNSVGKSPYEDYEDFSRAVGDVVARGEVPAFFTDVCARIRDDRSSGARDAHVLRNCPLDEEIPLLDLDDPVADKHAKKKTFVGEAFLELFGQLVENFADGPCA